MTDLIYRPYNPNTPVANSDPRNYVFGKNPHIWPKPFHGYESKDITVSGGMSDFSLLNHTELFSEITSGYRVTITGGSGDMSFKLNSMEEDAIPLKASAEFSIQDFVVTDILVTTASGVTASFHVFMLGWE
jgi:hypothetical protein